MGLQNGTTRTRSFFSRSLREEARKVAAVGETKSSPTRRYLFHVLYPIYDSAPLLPPYLSTDLLLTPSVLSRSPYRRIHATPSPLLCYLQQTARLCAPMGNISVWTVKATARLLMTPCSQWQVCLLGKIDTIFLYRRGPLEHFCADYVNVPASRLDACGRRTGRETKERGSRTERGKNS